ncbi:MAG: hypothetical protein FWH04_01690 [Oscillospiraceae bacterium]|nr:hypothetical protein [Oscillospiraceae bacterium]
MLRKVNSMSMVKAICHHCGEEILLDDQHALGFCFHCGTRATVKQAVMRYEEEQADRGIQQNTEEDDDVIGADGAAAQEIHLQLALAQEDMKAGMFESADSRYRNVLTKEVNNIEALWGHIAAKTYNLSPMPLQDPEDFAYTNAMNLFKKDAIPEVEEWKAAYFDAFEKSCEATIDSVDPCVFLEVEVFKWNAQSNSFAFPISRVFDLEPIFEEVLWANWNVLFECIRNEETKAYLVEKGHRVCKEIWDYFDTGFSNAEELKEGKLNRLLGHWYLRLTTGNIKSDVLKISVNNMSVYYLESCRLKGGYYDYYRYIKVDSAQRVLAAEHRHFPSRIGLGGDFEAVPEYMPVFEVLAIYDYILVLPTALYVRADPQNIPGYERSLEFQNKCRDLPCFQRSSLKHAIQMRPLSENHDTADASRRVTSCYIATAVYGDECAPQVLALRRFRDNTLNRYAIGRRLSDLYYMLSPPLAEKLKHSGKANAAVRKVLDVVVRIFGYTP